MLSTTAESIIQSGEYTLRERPSRLSRRVVCATLTACLGAVSFGYVLGYPSPVQNDLKKKLNWSAEQVTWFSVSLIMGNTWCCGKIIIIIVISINFQVNIMILSLKFCVCLRFYTRLFTS